MMDDVGERSVRRPAGWPDIRTGMTTQRSARRLERPCSELGTLGHLSVIVILWGLTLSTLAAHAKGHNLGLSTHLPRDQTGKLLQITKAVIY